MRGVCLVIVGCALGCTARSEAEPFEVSMLFVQTAGSMQCDGDVLTLEDVHNFTVGFSDRPERIVWREPTKDFVTSWTGGADSFSGDPPNATLTVFEDEDVEMAVVVLSNPRLEGERLSYDVRVLDGDAPASGGPCSLFIDNYQLFRSRTSPTPSGRADDRVHDRRRDIRQDRSGSLIRPRGTDSVDDIHQDRHDRRTNDRRDDRVDR